MRGVGIVLVIALWLFLAGLVLLVGCALGLVLGLVERIERGCQPSRRRKAIDTHGADAGAANSMIAGVPGPVASGQPEGPSKEREK